MIRVRELGRVEYADAFSRMREFTLARDEATVDELWLVEHPPVFTLGLAGRAEHVVAPGAIPVVASDRGGQVTYHGPGQVVAYTMVDLRRAGYFVRELVYRIEQSVIQVLEGLGVDGRRVPGAPGIYVPVTGSMQGTAATQGASMQAEERFRGMAKIAALGIKVSRGCSYHGVSLNVAMDLSPFGRIDPCGYRGLAATDLATLGVDISWSEAASRLSERLSAHL
jgi:lipoyl(octanoyl) transferase